MSLLPEFKATHAFSVPVPNVQTHLGGSFVSLPANLILLNAPVV